MENTENREEIDENLYLGLPPLLPNPRWETDLSSSLFNQTRPVSTPPNIETPPILPFTFSLNETPTFPSHVDPILDPLSSTPALRTNYRERPPTQQTVPMFLIPLDDLMINNHNRTNVPSNRNHLEEFPQLRFQRLLDLNRTGTGLNPVSTHPDTSPERLRNNILALEASRKSKKDGTTGTDTKTDRCQCGADFECNICLETCFEPIVTPCGHLFCWICLYKWIKAQTIGITECPVCKGEITENNLTPIYGRGGSNGSGPGRVIGSVKEENIPPRPSGRRTDSVRQLIRREVTGGGVQEDLQRVLVRLRQVTNNARTNRALQLDLNGEEVGTGTGTGTGTGGVELDLNESGTRSPVRRRRRYR